MESKTIKKTKTYHPFLVAIFPVLIIYSQNIGRVEIEQLFLPIILSIGLAFGLYYFFKLIIKNENKSAIIVKLIFIIFFSYGHIYYLLNDVTINEFDIGKTRYLIPVFGLVLSISIFFIIKTKKH